MVSRVALARLAPVLNVARPSTSAASRRALRGVRSYATSGSEHTVRRVMTKFASGSLTELNPDDRP